MSCRTLSRVALSALIGVSSFTLLACGALPAKGDIESAKQAMELAVGCKIDDAVAASQRASASGGIGGALGDVERVAILREAGRSSQADAARAAYLSKAGASSAAELDKDTANAVENIRAERAKRTGKRNC